jgi:hypothetical protein
MKKYIYMLMFLMSYSANAEQYILTLKINKTDITVVKPLTATNVSAGITCNDKVCSMISATENEEDIINWSWDFGDGNSANTKDAMHTYSSNGNYMVCLNIENQHNLTTQECKNIVIMDLVTTCSELTCDLSSSANEVTDWSWNLGDSSALNTNSTVNHTYQTSGNYNICLTVINSDETTSVQCKSVDVVKKIIQSYSGFIIYGGSHGYTSGVRNTYICVDKPASVTFNYRNESESCCDVLTINGTRLRGAGGLHTFNIPAGCRNIPTYFSNDGSIIESSNRGRVISITSEYNQ